MDNKTKARVIGVGGITLGAIVLSLSWLIPNKVSQFVATCNTVLGDLVSRADAATGAKCTTANFVTDYRWIFIVLGIGIVVFGLVALFGANNEAIREELDLE